MILSPTGDEASLLRHEFVICPAMRTDRVGIFYQPIANDAALRVARYVRQIRRPCRIGNSERVRP